MTAPEHPAETPETFRPSLRDRLRPLELLGLAGVFAGFLALVTFISLQEWKADWAERWPLWPIVGGIGFIVALVVLAMLALVGYQPPPAPGEQGVLGEKDEQRRATGH